MIIQNNNFENTYGWHELIIHHYESFDINMSNNYWGSNITEIINEGGNPKNLNAINDFYDDPNLGKVNYIPWLDAPYPTGQPVYPDTTYITGGTITQDSTWTKAQSPYVISGDVVVDNNATLTIEPGVEVLFEPNRDDQNSGRYNNNIEININYGQVIANGTVSDSIYFKSKSNLPQKSDWIGIYVANQSDSSINSFKYAVITDAYDAIEIDNQWVRIENSRIENIMNYGINTYTDRYPYPYIYDTKVSNCYTAIRIARSGHIESCMIENCTNGIIWGDDNYSTNICSIQFNTVKNCEYGITVHNKTPLILNNNLIDNTYSLYNGSTYNSDIKFNYWGTAVTTEEGAKASKATEAKCGEGKCGEGKCGEKK